MKKKSVIFYAEAVLIAIMALLAIVLAIIGAVNVNRKVESYKFIESCEFVRTTTAEEEDYSEDDTVCAVEYEAYDGKYTCTVNYTYEQWQELDANTIIGYVYELDDGHFVAFDHEATENDVAKAAKDVYADEQSPYFNAAIAIILLAAGLAVITFWAKFFTLYEKVWFMTILVLACVVSILFPEEDCNGINGIWIMALYLLDTFLNILCELLISKQSKWNFIVSVFVEITEILICILLAYRFATMATTLFFWLPIDIISFINWHKHPDKKDDELTQVRKLSGWGAVLIIAGIFVWTVVVGYLLSGLDITSDLFNGDKALANAVCYIDACASAVGVANGLFILFRFREQWIAWYICAALESVINIISGQYVLLVLKLGYFTNTTYGYIKWTRYISSRKKENEQLPE